MKAWKKETFRLPDLNLSLEVYKNEKGYIQQTKIIKKKVNKAWKNQKVTVSQIENLTDFQSRVYKTLLKIKRGQTITYKELAEKSGSPGAVRAIGTAMRKNPVPYLVPCHRVVRSNGELGNFSSPGGTSTKALMLQAEGIKMSHQGDFFE